MILKAENTRQKSGFQLLWRHRELFIWIAALVMLYTADLNADFTLCIPSNLGLKNCLGCGIGHSITALMHGEISHSWQYHFFGIPALGILIWQIVKLSRKLITDIKIN